MTECQKLIAYKQTVQAAKNKLKQMSGISILELLVYATGTQTIRRKNDFIQTCWLKRIGADKEKQLSQISTEISGTAYFLSSPERTVRNGDCFQLECKI